MYWLDSAYQLACTTVTGLVFIIGVMGSRGAPNMILAKDRINMQIPDNKRR